MLKESTLSDAPDRVLDPTFLDRFSIGDGPMSVAIKDVADIAGKPTRLACPAMRDAPQATRNAEVVSRLLEAGCRIVGKTNMHELAYGVTGLNRQYGTPVNPKFPALIPGGSSSGSATAVAGNDCDVSIGTDTGGSVRVPAACCGIYGLKPSFGRVSRDGFTPAETSLDCVGAFARSVDDLDKVMATICDDWQGGNTVSKSMLKLLKVDALPEITGRVTEVVRKADPFFSEIRPNCFEEAHQAGLTIIGREASQAFGHLIGKDGLDKDVESRLSKAQSITDQQVKQAELVRAEFTAEINKLLADCDALALPTMPIFPPTLSGAEDLMAMVNITSLCRPFNLSGHPAISIPLTPIAGAPVALQLVTAKGNDEKLIALARFLAGQTQSEKSVQGEQ